MPRPPRTAARFPGEFPPARPARRYAAGVKALVSMLKVPFVLTPV